MVRFDGKVAIVTGAASGIGAAIATRMAAEGASVLAADIDGDGLHHDSPGILNHVCDVTNEDQVRAMVATAVERFGGLDVLFNNAGIGSLGDVEEMSNALWERVFAVNVTSILYAARAAVPQMRARGGGAIVNTASISGIRGDYGFGAYNASKGAVVNYTRTLALDHARDNIRVNAFCPGFIMTKLTAMLEHVPFRHRWDEAIPLGRAGTAEEMAGVATFLASDDAAYMTGEIVVADGGLTAQTGQPDIHGPSRAMRTAAAQGGAA